MRRTQMRDATRGDQSDRAPSALTRFATVAVAQALPPGAAGVRVAQGFRAVPAALRWRVAHRAPRTAGRGNRA
jgi:hypothetical protein